VSVNPDCFRIFYGEIRSECYLSIFIKGYQQTVKSYIVTH